MGLNANSLQIFSNNSIPGLYFSCQSVEQGS